MNQTPNQFYVATSIPYANAEPHLGHAMEFVLADILARYHAQQGETVFFSTGTDEHGGKVHEKAKEMGVDTDRYVEQMAQKFKDLASALNVDYSKFIRTSDPDHEKRAALIWQKLADDIYKSKYVGLYDQREESFISEDEARSIKEHDPSRYDRLEKLEEENYFFKLSAYTEQIQEAIKSNELLVAPETKRNEILSLLESGLDDISVSRPKEKLNWGIPVPGDPDQVIYVWFEALMNYITTLGYPDGANFKQFWPCDVHVVGKDIIRFHTAIWPAMLLGLGEALPKAVFVHGFINVDGAKMSKSVGNVIAPIDIISAYGSDAFRYFFTRHIPSSSDGDFSWVKFENAYNSELANDLGNLVQRTASMIKRYQQGAIGNLPESMHDIGPYHQAMSNFQFDSALDYVWALIRGQNQYIENEKPWELAKESDQEHLREVLSYVVATLLQIADLLTPFMPDTSEAIIKTFGEGVVAGSGEVLFPKIHQHTDPQEK